VFTTVEFDFATLAHRLREFSDLNSGVTAALSDVRQAVEGDWPVAMLIGRFIPRHWVLIVEVDWLQWQCYEPSSGDVRSVEVAAVRRSRLSGLGYPRPFAFVLPKAETRSATT